MALNASACLKAGLLAALLAPPHAASAATAMQAVQSMLDCRRVSIEAARLACYDRAAASVTTDVLASHQYARGGDSQPDFDPAKKLHQRRSVAPTQPDDLKRVTALLVQVGSHDGKPTFILDNGQVWRAQEDDYVHIDPGRRNTATLSRSLLGLGYLLRVNNEHRQISVVREE